MRHVARVAGFTLMELLIAVAIVAILATLAVPGFQDTLMRGRRGDAITSLLSLQLAQEKWRANHAEYARLDELGWADATSLDGHYRLHLRERSASGFLATAQPRPAGPQQHDVCGEFALDQRGPVFAPEYADATCWRR
ncbi:MAG: type IV pilin protein [Gammaproteobacteria bacterium]